MSISNVASRLGREFTPAQAQLMAEELNFAYEALAKASDLTELKGIVREISLSQQRSEARLSRVEATLVQLAESQQKSEIRLSRVEATLAELAEAQKRTEVRVEELAQAQQKTEEALQQLAQAQVRTELSLQAMRREIGGIGNTLGYMLENEAYRHLPAVLASAHRIEISNKLIRQQIGDEEVNLLAEGTRNHKPVLVVGEAKSRLSVSDLAQLKKKVQEVEDFYPAAANREIVPVMVVHFARAKELERAAEEGVIVIQSFEW